MVSRPHAAYQMSSCAFQINTLQKPKIPKKIHERKNAKKKIRAQLTVEFLLQNIMLVFNWELLQQRLSNAKIPWII